ncbi:MAG TPA: hypothetical protein VNU95_14470 [Candidatus Acidoferrales bacterium]|nr:hypothetical protein [Candidatus Acidoferrales bacterium]
MKFFFYLAVVLGGILTGCSTSRNYPAGLPVCYHNAQYDFTFYLPMSWKGYSVLMRQWDGELRSPDYQKVVGEERGPIIVLRNPLWKTNDLYQDIPIYVFTRRQWDDIHSGKYDAAGAGGLIDELWHNGKYVFGIHSRTFVVNEELKGRHETENIVNQNCAGHPETHLYPE